MKQHRQHLNMLCILFLATSLFPLHTVFFSDSALAEENPRPSSRSDPDRGVEFRVLWSISSFSLGKDSEWGEDEAKNMLFKPLYMDSSSITFDGRSCTGIAFKTDQVNSTAYLSHRYDITPDIFSYSHDMLQVVRTNCSIEGFSEYMRLRDRRVVIHLHGVFFVFNPVVNY